MAGIEQISSSEIQQAKLDGRRFGRWTDSLERGIGVNAFVSIEGWGIIDSAVSGELVVLPAYGLIAIPIYRSIENSARVSAKRAEILREITKDEVRPEETLGITRREYNQLDIDHSSLSEVNRMRLLTLSLGMAGYGIIEEVSRGNWRSAAIAAGLALFIGWQNIRDGITSDRRREVLRKVFGQYKF